MEYTSVTADEFAALGGLDDWRVALGAIRGTFAAGSYPAAAELVVAISEAAERLVHHPDIDVRYPGTVSVTIMTHATGGLTTLDVDLAREISRLALAAGADADSSGVQVTELAIDTMDADRIRPFWAAVLDYRVAEDGSLADPRRQGWPIWFQQMDEPRIDRNRFHLDISVPHDVAEQRIAAAIAAGGALVSDARAKAFWILADADGNEACICTWQDRS
ncbi:VOC family protein [Ilumatobacter sp.]|uniref:VOC family protein n=1 Tax=Ilumatobacter sp. TaxID=1967498 RepID=UPI003AF9D515